MNEDQKITRDQADAIVQAVHATRRAWQVAGIRGGIREALERHQHVTYAELAYAALTVAADPAYATPAAISFDGPHWAPPKKLAVHRAQQCVSCGGVHTPGSPHVPPEAERVDGGDGRVAAMREALAETRRSKLCTHGVPYLNCTHEHHEVADA